MASTDLTDVLSKLKDIADVTSGADMYGKPGATRPRQSLPTNTEIKAIQGRTEVFPREIDNLPQQARDLVDKSTISAHEVYDYAIDQLESLKAQIDSQIACLTAKRDALNHSLKEFVTAALAASATIDEKSDLVSRLSQTPEIPGS